ncbi:hypothetical protein ANCDUO_27776 [Ancylostoma duodenale]|uniref:BOS complex subunit TMEM147 n=1 Tax=Ancylostoma duodenale TaxID=51022 RepID=A0A0C2FAZ6_9BILA|nr:hypothetical protein ANCDUO_27776 [Ancylostoma duodenale]
MFRICSRFTPTSLLEESPEKTAPRRDCGQFTASAGLNEYSSFWRCAQASGGYFLTQLIKLLLLATFFPATDAEGFSFLPELLKSSADVVDVIGMHIVMTHLLNGKGEVRVALKSCWVKISSLSYFSTEILFLLHLTTV